MAESHTKLSIISIRKVSETINIQDKPKLRWPLDIQQIEQGGERYVVLRDLERVAGEPALIPIALMPIISRFDGERSVADIVAEGSEFGVTVELVGYLLAELDRMHFLETPKTSHRREAILRDYRASPIREAAHAGTVYPSDPKELREVIEKFISEAEVRPRANLLSESVVGYISPHIDYHRGWKTYAAGYSILKASRPPEFIFLLGTAHQPAKGLFHLTRKAFKTPFGITPTAEELVTRLAKGYGEERSFSEEMLHRTEHSLELQLPFLAHRFDSAVHPPIVPVLVGSLHQMLRSGRYPEEHAEFNDFVGPLAELVRELRQTNREFLFYGGIDLAHMGLHFGDRLRASNTRLAEIELRDKALLEAVLAADERKLFEHIEEDLDSRRICGFPSLYTMLSTFRRAGIRARGELIEYRQAADPVTDCVVTFASAFWRLA